MIFKIIMQLISSAIIGCIICTSYRASHSRAIYSRSFNISLMIFTILSSLSITILSRNIVLAVGALSIVRYRSVIKDHRDMLFLFWAVAAGIGCGVEEYVITGMGSLAVFTAVIICKSLHNYERKLLIIRGSANLENFVMEIVTKNFKEKVNLIVNNSNDNITEIIYEIPKSSSKEMNTIFSKIKEELYKINGIQCVNIVQQIEEMGV